MASVSRVVNVSDIALPTGRRQAIAQTNDDLLSVRTQEQTSVKFVFGYKLFLQKYISHYNDVIMGAIASQITSLTIVYSIVYSDTDQRKHHSSASLAFVRGIHRSPVNSPHKWPVTRKLFPFDDVIMKCCLQYGGHFVLVSTVHCLNDTRVYFWDIIYYFSKYHYQ